MTPLLFLTLLLLVPSWVYGQTVNSRTEAGNGTPITATGNRLDVQTQTGLALDATLTARFPTAFASADNIAAQTATFMHGGLMAWDSGGGNWDRVLLTAGALNVQIQNSSLAVTGTFWQATQPVSGTVTANAGSNLNTSALALDTSVDGLEGGVGASADAAATVGSTGSVTAKLRLMTSQLDAIQTAVQLIDNMISGAGANITQFGGSNVVTGVGTSGVGIPRTTLSNDSSLAPNQSVNMNQLAGAAPSVTNPMPSRLSDGAGFIDSDVIGSKRYLKTSSVQDIELSANNSSTANLASGANFTGTSESTLGVGSIQVNLFADQNATIQVQQAQEDPGVNWNVIDSWAYTASSNGSDAARTIQATGASVRVVATNTGSASTTVFRLTTAMCPICDALPRGLTQLGNFKAALVEPLVNRYGIELGTVTNPIIVNMAPSLQVPANPLVTQTSRLVAGPFNTSIGISGDRLKVDGTPNPDVCATSKKMDAAISQTATSRVIQGVPGQSIYVCAIRLLTATTETTSEWEGTGTNCGTGTIAHSGSTTVANGEPLANGYASGNGLASVISLSPGTDFCIAQNGSNRVSGKVSYVYGN